MPTQDDRLTRLEARMDKYDEILMDLKTIVIALKATEDATRKSNQRWINSILGLLMIGATIVGGIAGSIITHLIH